MKRGTLIALGILVALVGLYLVTRDTTQTRVGSPLTIEKVEGLSRIEITPAPSSSDEASKDSNKQGASEGDKPDLIVFEKKDDEWWLTRPVESPVSGDTAETIEKAFTETIRTDDIRLSSTNASKYKVDDKQGVEVALYGEDTSSPDREFVVGEQMSVSETNAKRTYVRKAGSKKIYRAQMAVGDFVRQGVDEFRSKQILDADEKKVSSLEFNRREGPKIVLNKQDKSWSIAKPKVDFEVDGGEVESIVGALSSLNASGFAPDKQLSAIGLDQPVVEVTVSTDKNDHKLLVGRVDSGDKPEYYVKKPDEPFTYKLSSYTGKKLDTNLSNVRSKTPRTFDKKAITRVEFAGEDDVVVKKSDDGSWTLVRPDSDKSLNKSKLDGHLDTIAELRVKDFPDVSPEEAGLARGAQKVAVRTKNDTHMVLIGDKVGDGDDRYIKFGDRSDVFTISKYTAEQLMPSVDAITGKSKPKGGPGMKKGMGKGMGRMKKMRMMKKLKRRMRKKRRGR